MARVTDVQARESRQQLVAGTARLLATRGYHACSVQELSAASGSSRNQLFHYFPTKEALAQAALDWCFNALRAEQLLRAEDSAGELAKQPLAQRLGALLDAAGEHDAPAAVCLPLLASLAGERAALPAALAQQLDAALDELRLALRVSIRSQRSGPRGDAPRARELAAQQLAMLLGACLLRSCGITVELRNE